MTLYLPKKIIFKLVKKAINWEIPLNAAKQFLLRDRLFIPQKIGNTAQIYSPNYTKY